MRQVILLGAGLALLVSGNVRAQAPPAGSANEAGATSATAVPSPVAFQSDALRHRREGVPSPVTARRTAEPRAQMLARLAREGRRPLRLNWRRPASGSDWELRDAEREDRFAWVTMAVQEPPRLFPPWIPGAEFWTAPLESSLAASTCWCTYGSPTAPGRVPDGTVLLGTLLTVERSAQLPGELDLAWGPSCSPQATDYSVHEGIIGEWYSHRRIACTTGNALNRTITPSEGGRYYLVVPLSDDAEGSYGVSSELRERPPSESACRPIAMVAPCP